MSAVPGLPAGSPSVALVVQLEARSPFGWAAPQGVCPSQPRTVPPMAFLRSLHCDGRHTQCPPSTYLLPPHRSMMGS